VTALNRRPAPTRGRPDTVAHARALPARARPHVAVPPRSTTQGRRTRDLLSPATIFFLCVTAVLGLAYALPASTYLSPRSGAGYALGIVGGSMMLLLLVYPLRKRLPLARYLGSTRFWFRTHMTLGILGPAAILVHSNFSFGATNSNVAMVCMLVVAGSGLFGRYAYGRIHLELYGRQATLEDLKTYSHRMRQVTSAVSYLPELARRIDDEEDDIARRIAGTPLLLRPIVGLGWAVGARRRLHRAVREAVALGADRRRDPARDPLRASAYRYIDDRIVAMRRVLDFEAFERLFSLWHTLHMPLFVMLLIAGTVHVFAVHLY
jgi:hypothetical protein